MKTLCTLLIFISYAYASIDESALASLQTIDHWNAFRVVLSDTNTECFYIPVKANDTIHVIYQTLKGGNSLIRTLIIDPLGETVHFQPKHQFGWYTQEDVKSPGTYQLCFTNDEYFASKAVYLAVLALHQDLLHEANIDVAKEKQDNATAFLDDFSVDVLTSLNSISSTLYRITAYQTVARVHHLHDTYIVEANATYVQYWAIWQIITMIVCSTIQVYSIRRLFK